MLKLQIGPHTINLLDYEERCRDHLPGSRHLFVHKAVIERRRRDPDYELQLLDFFVVDQMSGEIFVYDPLA